jgi:hypothetical protein
MTRDEALARIDDLLGTAPTRERIWDALTKNQRRAILHAAGIHGAYYVDAANLHPEHFAQAWAMVERFANLSTKIKAANDRAIDEIVAQVAA